MEQQTIHLPRPVVGNPLKPLTFARFNPLTRALCLSLGLHASAATLIYGQPLRPDAGLIDPLLVSKITFRQVAVRPENSDSTATRPRKKRLGSSAETESSTGLDAAYGVLTDTNIPAEFIEGPLTLPLLGEHKALNVGSKILMQLTIASTGQVEDILILEPVQLKDTDELFEIISQWRFQPALVGGMPSQSTKQIEIDFRPEG